MASVVLMATYRIKMDRMVLMASDNSVNCQRPNDDIQSSDGQSPRGHIIKMVTEVNMATYRVQMDRMVPTASEIQWSQWSIWQHTECRWTEWSQRPQSSNGHSGPYGNIQSADGQNGPNGHRIPMVTVVNIATYRGQMDRMVPTATEFQWSQWSI
ncbi:hypothetical protein DPMN_108884 [Dreissena polymorpha]|uniref:Uncharacterized protein n=1 Tax=Dreissena polymorpha TaxID=45954 RepID=A0A9D4QLE9_DREPO|nr:hypothetical protein DPMN_108884 [Dreissena polymorpha]